MYALIDTANLYYYINKQFPECKLDYAKYKDFLVEKFGVTVCKAFVPAGPEGFIEYLKGIGFEVVTKMPQRTKVFGKPVFKTDWNVELTMHVMQLKPVVLGSSSLDLLPLIKAEGKHIDVVAAGIPRAFQNVARTTTEIGESLLA